MSIVSSSWMLVKRESADRLPIKNSESCSTSSSAKASGSFTVELKISKRPLETLLVYRQKYLAISPQLQQSLFTNIPLEEIVGICTNTLFENNERVEDLSLWVPLQVQYGLMLFLYSLKITGYKVLHLSLNLITIVGMLMISLCLLISPKHLEDF